MALFTKPVRLKPEHRETLEAFECGERALDLWLKTKALSNEINGGRRSFVSFSTETGELAGFFSLASHSVEHDELRSKLRRNQPAPLPVILLGRLAVSKRYQRHGLGESLLSEAVRIAGLASESIGVVALVVHPISEEASAFYRKHGFSIVKTEKPMLFLGLHSEAV